MRSINQSIKSLAWTTGRKAGRIINNSAWDCAISLIFGTSLCAKSSSESSGMVKIHFRSNPKWRPTPTLRSNWNRKTTLLTFLTSVNCNVNFQRVAISDTRSLGYYFRQGGCFFLLDGISAGGIRFINFREREIHYKFWGPKTTRAMKQLSLSTPRKALTSA